jgi:2-polyprenyl-6-methoxyphenol hydroxylase-like FAD-dependent oxidoreductase
MTGGARTGATPDGLLDLVIVGGGPVGLVAGLLAHDAGLRFRVLERDPAPRRHSRAIGIHPPALGLLDRLGVADPLVQEGTPIRRGHALAGPERVLGSLDFGLLPPPWPFILTLPQWRTEQILEARLEEVAPGALRRGVTVTGFAGDRGRPREPARAPDGSTDTGVILHTEDDRDPSGRTLPARYLMACDGKSSRLRSAAGIGWKGGPYRPTYVMGDFPTANGAHPGVPGCTPPGTDAAIYLHREGLVESFPLEPGVRRWVAQAGQGGEEGESPLETLVRAVRERCGVRLDPAGCLMSSAFGVERYRAERFWSGPIVLAGDAAHLVSPIGGQGMNLGWLNAADAVRSLAEILAGRVPAGRAASRFEVRAGRRFREVAARAEQNMLLANRSSVPRLRTLGVQLLLHSPARRILARRFSMAGI